MYNDYNYFDYEAYQRLISEIGKKIRDKERGDVAAADSKDLIGVIRALSEYVSYVDEIDAKIRVLSDSLYGEDYREYADVLNLARWHALEACQCRTDILNRVAANYGCGKIFRGNRNSRQQIEDFCLEVTAAIFEGREPIAA